MSYDTIAGKLAGRIIPFLYEMVVCEMGTPLSDRMGSVLVGCRGQPHVRMSFLRLGAGGRGHAHLTQ